MARKSIPGGKSSRTTKSREQVVSDNPVEATEANAIRLETPAPKPRSEAGVTDVPASLVENVRDTGGLKATKVEPRKLEMVKNESRKNLVPINLENEIRQRAFELYEQHGCKDGHEAEDWLAAEREVLQRYRQQSA